MRSCVRACMCVHVCTYVCICHQEKHFLLFLNVFPLMVELDVFN